MLLPSLKNITPVTNGHSQNLNFQPAKLLVRRDFPCISLLTTLSSLHLLLLTKLYLVTPSPSVSYVSFTEIFALVFISCLEWRMVKKNERKISRKKEYNRTNEQTNINEKWRYNAFERGKGQDSEENEKQEISQLYFGDWYNKGS